MAGYILWRFVIAIIGTITGIAIGKILFNYFDN